MHELKRLAAVGVALALGALGATGTAAANAAPSTVRAAAVSASTPTTKYFTLADVAAAAAHLPKGMHVMLGAAHSSTIHPGIVSHNCMPGWGVEVHNAGGGCTAYGYVGTTPYLGYYATIAYTNNNYGSLTFNKDLNQYNGFSTAPCEVFEFNTGTYTNALLQYVSISSWVGGLTCGNELIYSW